MFFLAPTGALIVSNIKCQMSIRLNLMLEPTSRGFQTEFCRDAHLMHILIANKMQTLYYRFRMHTKTLPEAQRTQGIDSVS